MSTNRVHNYMSLTTIQLHRIDLTHRLMTCRDLLRGASASIAGYAMYPSAYTKLDAIIEDVEDLLQLLTPDERVGVRPKVAAEDDDIPF